MKGYVGRRDFDGVKVYVVTEKTLGGLGRAPLKHVVLHSPDGFEWGYLGSGPADLALAILADFFGDNEAWKAEPLHQSFKAAFVAGFAKESWSLDEGEIRRWVEEQEGRQP